MNIINLVLEGFYPVLSMGIENFDIIHLKLIYFFKCYPCIDYLISN